MNFIVKLCVITAVLALSESSTEISCKYGQSAMLFQVTYYQCVVESIKPAITKPTQTIIIKDLNSHRGTQLINGLTVKGKTVNYFPRAIHQTFRSLEMITIIQSHLREINQLDLRPFSKLQLLVLSENEISKIDRNLFAHNPNLEVINLNSNKIKSIDASVFDGLTKLSSLFLADTCVDKVYRPRSEIVASVRSDIERSCVEKSVEDQRIDGKSRQSTVAGRKETRKTTRSVNLTSKRPTQAARFAGRKGNKPQVTKSTRKPPPPTTTKTPTITPLSIIEKTPLESSNLSGSNLPQSRRQRSDDQAASNSQIDALRQEIILNSQRLDQLEEKVAKLEKDFFKNQTNLENALIENEEKVRENADDIVKFANIRTEIEDIKLKLATALDTTVRDKMFSEMHAKLSEVERASIKSAGHSAIEAKVRFVNEQIESLRREFEEAKVASPRPTDETIDDIPIIENLLTKLKIAEESDAERDHEIRLIVWSGIFISVFFTVLIISVASQRNKPKNENHHEMANIDPRGNNAPFRVTPLPGPPFVIYSNTHMGTNPFKSDQCVDGTSMYDADRNDNTTAFRNPTYDHPQEFMVNKSTANLFDDSIYDEVALDEATYENVPCRVEKSTSV